MRSADSNRSRNDTGHRWLTVPNAVTLVRFALILPIFILILRGSDPVAVLILVAVFGASDWIDGFLARALGQESRAGQILDPIADRIGIIAIIVALAIVGAVPWWAIVVIVLVDIVVSVATVTSKRHSHLHVTWVGKIRTALIMVSTVAIVAAPVFGTWLLTTGQTGIGIGAVLHIVAGTQYARQLLPRG